MTCDFYNYPHSEIKFCLTHQMETNKEAENCPIGKLEERIIELEDKLANLELTNGWGHK